MDNKTPNLYRLNKCIFTIPRSIKNRMIGLYIFTIIKKTERNGFTFRYALSRSILYKSLFASQIP